MFQFLFTACFIFGIIVAILSIYTTLVIFIYKKIIDDIKKRFEIVHCKFTLSPFQFGINATVTDTRIEITRKLFSMYKKNPNEDGLPYLILKQTLYHEIGHQFHDFTSAITNYKRKRKIDEIHSDLFSVKYGLAGDKERAKLSIKAKAYINSHIFLFIILKLLKHKQNYHLISKAIQYKPKEAMLDKLLSKHPSCADRLWFIDNFDECDSECIKAALNKYLSKKDKQAININSTANIIAEEYKAIDVNIISHLQTKDRQNV